MQLHKWSLGFWLQRHLLRAVMRCSGFLSTSVSLNDACGLVQGLERAEMLSADLFDPANFTAALHPLRLICTAAAHLALEARSHHHHTCTEVACKSLHGLRISKPASGAWQTTRRCPDAPKSVDIDIMIQLEHTCVRAGWCRQQSGLCRVRQLAVGGRILQWLSRRNSRQKLHILGDTTLEAAAVHLHSSDEEAASDVGYSRRCRRTDLRVALPPWARSSATVTRTAVLDGAPASSSRVGRGTAALMPIRQLHCQRLPCPCCWVQLRLNMCVGCAFASRSALAG